MKPAIIAVASATAFGMWLPSASGAADAVVECSRTVDTVSVTHTPSPDGGPRGVHAGSETTLLLQRCEVTLRAMPQSSQVDALLGFIRLYINADSEAVRLLRSAAAQGDARAETGLAIMFAGGFGGLSQDHREAARLYRLAA
jgi:TPR repeat protein